jgi:8-amino-7-oxononanoate synthase
MARHDAIFLEAVDRAEAQTRRRRLAPGVPLAEGRIERDGRVLVNFSANDYLGLSRHPLLIERAHDWARRHGAGSGASRLVTGTLDAVMALEARIAAFKGTEDALILASGWQANAGVLPALLAAVSDKPLVFCDRLNHASLHHGLATAGVRQIRFRHNDLDHLEALLAERADLPGRRFIVTESVFSMDGDRVDLARLTTIAAAHDAFIYLDEAHATGVLGPGGAGLSATVPGGVDLVMGTFSKAFGGFGAYVAGSRAMIDWLVNGCGGLIYTTAPPPAVMGAIEAALDLMPSLDAERARVAGHGDRLRAALARAGIDHGASDTQIVPAILGSEAAVLAAAKQLETLGMLAAPIRPPTVPAGRSRLRLALSAAHHEEDVARLGEALASL